MLSLVINVLLIDFCIKLVIWALMVFYILICLCNIPASQLSYLRPQPFDRFAVFNSMFVILRWNIRVSIDIKTNYIRILSITINTNEYVRLFMSHYVCVCIFTIRKRISINYIEISVCNRNEKCPAILRNGASIEFKCHPGLQPMALCLLAMHLRKKRAHNS